MLLLLNLLLLMLLLLYQILRHIRTRVVLLQWMPSPPLGIHSLLVMPHVILITDRALLVLLVHALLLRLPASHVLPIGSIRVDVLVRLLVDITSTIASTVGGFWGWSSDRQLTTRIKDL